MKSICLLLVLLATTGYAYSQPKIPAIDSSPLDITYYPSDYPLLKIQDKLKEPLIARAIFSRPKKNGRVIFGELIEYNKVWRLGANEATEIEFYQPVTINKVKIKKGRYTLYALPTATSWKLIVNKETDTWGSFKYDATKDVARIDVPVKRQIETLDSFVMAFEKTPQGASLLIAWDNLKVSLPFTY